MPSLAPRDADGNMPMDPVAGKPAGDPFALVVSTREDTRGAWSADGRWIALTAVCTHLGCTVQYEPQADRIHCACHGGVYNAYTGANVSGPPPKPLKLFKVAVNEAGVEISRA